MSLQANYQLAQQNIHAGAALALIGLTGLSLQQSQQAQIDLDGQYARVNDAVYPLSEQAVALLRDIPALRDIDLQQGLDDLAASVDELRSALYSAIWATSDDGQLLQQMANQPSLNDLPQEMIYPFSIAQQLDPSDTVRFNHTQATIQSAVDYMLDAPSDAIPLWRKLLDAKLVFLVVSTAVSGMNLVHNLVMGRLLNPADYGQVTFANTLLLIIGLIPTAMQTVSARYSAIYDSQAQDGLMHALWRTGTRYGWLIGALIASLLALAAPLFVEWFQLRDVWIVYPLVFAIPFFLTTGTDRGLLQGKERYYWLSGAYFIEGTVRLGLGALLTIMLTQANRGVDGAIWALGQSLIATWFISWWCLYRQSPVKDDLPEIDSEEVTEERKLWVSLFGFTGMALLGQALITNSDFVLVKSFFDATEAGLYAAISVTGRVVYFGTLPLTVLIVPLIAREQSLGNSTRNLFLLLMGSGIVLCGSLIVVSFLFAPLIIELLYGAEYVAAAGLLPAYTIAAALFVLTNLLVTYRVALGKGGETWMPLLAAIAQIIGVIFFHESLMQIIIVQISIMSVLFVGVAWRSTR